MKVKGKYREDDNFIDVFSNNTLYTFAKNTNKWAYISVGEVTATGKKFTQETYNRLEFECKCEGEFELY